MKNFLLIIPLFLLLISPINAQDVQIVEKNPITTLEELILSKAQSSDEREDLKNLSISTLKNLEIIKKLEIHITKKPDNFILRKRLLDDLYLVKKSILQDITVLAKNIESNIKTFESTLEIQSVKQSIINQRSKIISILINLKISQRLSDNKA